MLPHQLQNIRCCPVCLRVYVGCAHSGDPRVFSLQRVFLTYRNFPHSLAPKVIPPRSRYRLTRHFFVEILRHFHQITDHETRQRKQVFPVVSCQKSCITAGNMSAGSCHIIAGLRRIPGIDLCRTLRRSLCSILPCHNDVQTARRLEDPFQHQHILRRKRIEPVHPHITGRYQRRIQHFVAVECNIVLRIQILSCDGFLVQRKQGHDVLQLVLEETGIFQRFRHLPQHVHAHLRALHLRDQHIDPLYKGILSADAFVDFQCVVALLQDPCQQHMPAVFIDKRRHRAASFF